MVDGVVYYECVVWLLVDMDDVEMSLFVVLVLLCGWLWVDVLSLFVCLILIFVLFVFYVCYLDI